MSRIVRPALIFFFVSGVTGLVYEVLWTRRLTLTFGHTVLAVSTVLTAYMAGLALGSVTGGRWADRQAARPEGTPARFLAAYGLLEAVVGAWALASLPLLGLVERGYLALAAAGWQGPPLHLAAFAGSMLVLVPPTVAMGATLPVMGRLLVHREREVGPLLSRLYGLNTLGAFCGASAAGLVLLPAWGLQASLLATAGLNLALGVAAWALARAVRVEPRAEVPSPDAGGAPGPDAPGEVRALGLVPLCFGLAGVASMACQVGWTRGLVLSLGSSTYAFSTILAAFLAGLGLGSLLYPRLLGNRAPRLEHLAVLQLLVGVLGGATIPLLERFPLLFLDLVPYLQESFWRVLAVQFLLAALLLLGPTFLMGLMFPLASHLHTRGLAGLGRSVGEVYGANTLGCIAGSFLSGFAAVPLLGAWWTLKLACLVNLSVAAVLFLVAGSRLPARAAGVALALGGAGAILLVPAWDPGLMSAGFAVSASRWAGATEAALREERRPPAFYRDGLSCTVSVHVRNPKDVFLRVNGKTDASLGSADLQTMYLLGVLPALVHRAPRTAAVVGLGSGITLEGLAAVPGVERIDCVELEPAVVEAARYWKGYNGAILEDPRVHLHVTDGRTFILQSPARYDLLVSEPSNPWIAGVGNLFTRDFYQECRSRLRPGGVMAQWLQLYNLSDREVRLVLRSFYEAFPHGQVWQTSFSDLLLLGSAEPRTLDPERVARAWDASPGLQRILDRIGLDRPEQLAGHFLFTREEAIGFFASSPLNTDDRPLLEFLAPLNLYRRGQAGENAALVRRLRRAPLPPGMAITPERRVQAAVAWIQVGDYDSVDRLLGEPGPLPGRELLLARFARRVAPDGALRAFQRALAATPPDPATPGLFAEFLLERGRWVEAARQYEAALRSPAPGAAARLRTGAGIALRESGRPREAVPLLQAAARETAESWPQTELGRTLLALGDPDGARAAMEEAVRRNPADVDAWRGIAVVRLGQGEPDEAASAFREALHLVPDHVEGLVGLGTAEAAAGHPVRARQAFQEALRLAPEHPGARQGLQELGARKVEEPGRSPGNAP